MKEKRTSNKAKCKVLGDLSEAKKKLNVCIQFKVPSIQNVHSFIDVTSSGSIF